MLHSQTTNKIKGIDSIRFIAALFVSIRHIGQPPIFNGMNENSLLPKIACGIYNNSLSGPAAVIVFFVISGFCIHYPYTGGKIMQLGNFYAKRFIRIFIPMLVVIIIGYYLDVKMANMTDSILWSLLAEMIYYALYPFLLKVSKQYSWNKLLIFSYILAYALVFTFLYINRAEKYDGSFPQYGVFNFIVGLPCWLLGVKLAETYHTIRFNPVSKKSIIITRMGVWIASILCSMIRFHFNIGYNISLGIFAIVVYFWLTQEISYYQNRVPSRLLERGGNWSYSLYLCHLFAYPLFLRMSVPDFGPLINAFILIFIALINSYIYYLLVEKPSHKLSQSFNLDSIKQTYLR